MNDWRVFDKEVKMLLSQRLYLQAQIKVQEGLYSFPNHVGLLSVASSVYRAAGSREKSLECAQALISHHPDRSSGYSLAAQDLLALQRVDEAQSAIQQALDKFPQQATILTLANDVYRAAGDRNKALDFALGLIYHHPNNWVGYVRAAQDLVALKRLDEARIKIQEGLDRFPQQDHILVVAYDVYRAAGDRNKALDFALGLIYHHPDRWNGYSLATQDLIALKRFDEARAKVQEGIKIFPGMVSLQKLSAQLDRDCS